MAEREEIFYESQDGINNIRAMIWRGKTKPRAVLQIAHGMVEHIERYGEFAKYLADRGYLVVGNDHLGHGKSVITEKSWGYFCKENMCNVLVEDMNTLRKKIQSEYQELPYFILGHSMGSFLVRRYISVYAKGLAGAIIMGTGDLPDKTLKFGINLIKFMAVFKGWYYRSSLINKMVIGNNNSHFKVSSEGKCWLTKDEKIVEAYYKDPACTFTFTLNGFYTLLQLIYSVNQTETMEKIPKDLPIFLVSGEEDMLGECGKGVLRVYDKFEKLNILDIIWKLYSNDRHEILNELDREKVYKDVEAWMNIRI